MAKKKRKKKKVFLIAALAPLALIGAYALLNPNQTLRKTIEIYNRCSVFFERIQNNRVYAENFGTTIPRGYHIHGIDVSRYQRKIVWESVSKVSHDSMKINFAFIKATEGKTLSDRYYSYNMKEARKHNIICGAYHYYKPSVNSKEQALNFISLVELKNGDLPPVLDIEEESPFGKENMKKGIKNWLEIVEKHYRMKPIIYTSNHFHETYLSGKEFKEYPFWIAHYYKKEIKTSGNWLFWQHSDKARINGINAWVDMNVYNGNIEELKKLCKKN